MAQLKKGILSIEELDERKKQIAQRLMKKFIESGIGLMHQDSEYDKYTFKHEVRVDCQSRLHICKAVCCRFPFALSRQDVEEGIINPDLAEKIKKENGEIYCCSRRTN